MSGTQKLSIFFALIICGTWFYFMPHLAIRDMKSAIEEKDSVKLADHVNFPALKESLKANFNANLISHFANEKDNKPIATFVTVLTAAFMNPMIDALVTPEGLAMIMKGDKPLLAKNKTQSNPTDSKSLDKDVDQSMSYENFDRFVLNVKKKGSDEEPVGLVFNRDGIFSWKLSAIRMPK